MSTARSPKKAVILGGSSVIGRELCARYLSSGYEVTAYHHSFEPRGEVDARLDSVRWVRLDLADLEAVAQHLKTNETEISKSDVLVCLASNAQPTSLGPASPLELSSALAVGALSNFLFLGILGPKMAERGWGRIVLGSSIGVKFGGGLNSFAYSLAHHTSEFIPQAARRWAANGVLTNVVRIGVTDTPIHDAFGDRDFVARVAMIPAQRAAKPAEIADFLYWHGSDLNTFVTGQVVSISGGE